MTERRDYFAEYLIREAEKAITAFDEVRAAAREHGLTDDQINGPTRGEIHSHGESGVRRTQLVLPVKRIVTNLEPTKEESR